MTARTHSEGLSRGELLAALAIVVIWGVNFVFMKLALRDFTAFQLGAARYLCAALPLALFVRPPRVPWKWVVLYGLFQGVGQFGFLFCALMVGMTASLASVLLQTQVFFTAVLGFALLGERAGRPLQAGLVLAACGLACFALNYAGPQGGAGATTVWGFLLSVCAAAMWAASNIVARKAQQAGSYGALNFIVWCSLVPVLPFVLASLLFDAPATRLRWMDAAWSSWLAVGFLGWVATVAAYGMWTRLLQHHPANRVAPFSLGVPVVGLAAGMLVLGEAISTWQWAGIAFVVLALCSVMFGAQLAAGLADSSRSRVRSASRRAASSKSSPPDA